MRRTLKPSLHNFRRFFVRRRVPLAIVVTLLAPAAGISLALMQADRQGGGQTTLVSDAAGTTLVTPGGQTITSTPSGANSGKKSTPNPQPAPSTTTTKVVAPTASQSGSSDPASTTPVSDDSGTIELTLSQREYAADQPEQIFVLKLIRSGGYASTVETIQARVADGSASCTVLSQNGDIYELSCKRAIGATSETGTLNVTVITKAGDSFSTSAAYRMPAS